MKRTALETSSLKVPSLIRREQVLRPVPLCTGTKRRYGYLQCRCVLFSFMLGDLTSVSRSDSARKIKFVEVVN